MVRALEQRVAANGTAQGAEPLGRDEARQETCAFRASTLRRRYAGGVPRLDRLRDGSGKETVVGGPGWQNRKLPQCR